MSFRYLFLRGVTFKVLPYHHRCRPSVKVLDDLRGPGRSGSTPIVVVKLFQCDPSGLRVREERRTKISSLSRLISWFEVGTGVLFVLLRTETEFDKCLLLPTTP